MTFEECNHKTCTHNRMWQETFYHHCADPDCDNYIKKCPVHQHSGVCKNLP